MEVLQQPTHSSQLTVNSHKYRAINKLRCSCLPGNFADTRNSKLMGGKQFGSGSTVRIADKALGRRMELLSPQLVARRKCVLSAVKSHSYSDFDFDHSKEDGTLTKRAGFFEWIKNYIDGLNHDNFRTELLILALPAIAGQAIDPLAQLAETAFIGRLGAVELASAGVSVTIFNIISKLFNIPLLSITTSFVAEEVSKNAIHDSSLDKGSQLPSEKPSKRKQLPSVSTALLLSVVIGAVEAIALFFGAGQFLKLMGITSASPMSSPAQKFLSLRALGAPAVVVSLAIQGIFRGFKDTQTPVFCIGLGNLSAVCFLPIFVYALQFGLVGAAIATVASQYITAALLIWSLSKKAVLLPPKLTDLKFDGYIKSGGLLLGRTLSVLITMTLGTSMAARLGPLSMAAHQICMQVWLAVSLLSDALALSAQALIASSFAKCDYQKVKDITYFVLKMGVSIGLLLAVVLGASFGSLAELFTKDAEVLQIVKTGILFVSASQPINALAFIFDGLHYGVSDFSYAAYSMMVVGILSSAWLLYAPARFGLPGVWLGLTLFMTLRMAAGFIRLQWRNGPWWFLWEGRRMSEVAN